MENTTETQKAFEEILELANHRILGSKTLSWKNETGVIIERIRIKFDSQEAADLVDLLGRDYDRRINTLNRIDSMERQIERLNQEIKKLKKDTRDTLGPDSRETAREIRSGLNDSNRFAMKIAAHLQGVSTENNSIVWDNSHLASLTE